MSQEARSQPQPLPQGSQGQRPQTLGGESQGGGGGGEAGPRDRLAPGRVSQGFQKSQPRRFWRRGAGSWAGNSRPSTLAASVAQSRVGSTATGHISPCLVWHLEVPVIWAWPGPWSAWEEWLML